MRYIFNAGYKLFAKVRAFNYIWYAKFRVVLPMPAINIVPIVFNYPSKICKLATKSTNLPAGYQILNLLGQKFIRNKETIGVDHQ
jgi:hypothetical protein